MLSSNRFAQLVDVTPDEQLEARTRAFEGDGTSFLPVPGLERLDSVRIGHMELPMSEPRRYPKDGQGANFDHVEEPLVEIQKRSDGTAVLVRSIISNDGIWPKGVSIFVRGDWDAMVGSGTVADPALPSAPPQPDPEKERMQQEIARLNSLVAEQAASAAAASGQQNDLTAGETDADAGDKGKSDDTNVGATRAAQRAAAAKAT